MSGAVYYQNVEQEYGVIHIQRPEKHNAISNEMIPMLKECLQEAKQDVIKFLVVTGAGDKMFCAGGDLENLHGDLTPDEAFSHLYPMKEVLFDIVSFPVPTICLLNGNALGGGCELATSCDFRIAKEGTTFGFVQTKLGIIPGWGGGILLYEKVQPSFAYQWLVEAEVYDANFLEQKGWIHHVVETGVWSDQEKLFQPYTSKSVEQMKILKDQYKKKISVLGLAAQMNEEVRNCATLWDSIEHKAAVKQFLSRK